MKKIQVAAALLAAIVAALVLALGRGFPPHLAVVAGVAVGALAYATFSTVERMRGIYRR